MIKICSAEDIPKGTVISANVDGVQLALVHGEDDNFYAVHDECSHAAVALSEGEVDGCTPRVLAARLPLRPAYR